VALLVHAGATWFMVGLAWMVQVVHYPLMAWVGHAAFPAYEGEHTRRMGALLALPWGAEGLSALALVALAPPGAPRWLALLGLGLLGLIVASTVALQVPRHRELTAGFAAHAHRRLVTTSWLRTAAWTARGIIALALLALLA